MHTAIGRAYREGEVSDIVCLVVVDLKRDRCGQSVTLELNMTRQRTTHPASDELATVILTLPLIS